MIDRLPILALLALASLPAAAAAPTTERNFRPASRPVRAPPAPPPRALAGRSRSKDGRG